MDVTSQIADLAGPGAAAAGLVVDSVKVSPAGKRTRVLVTVDLPPTEVGSAELDAVAQASRAIGAALDEANVPKNEYVLEVSTPGTDRPLTELHHFMRARTRVVELDLADGHQLKGRLMDVADDALVLDTADAPVPFEGVVRGQIVVELKRLEP